jgi:HK97 family phage major capsid protein
VDGEPVDAERLRQFETGSGALKFPALQDNPPSLLGRSIYENSEMDGLINPAATESSLILLYGDLSNFVITQRAGATVGDC